jgi:hypothetical protein
MNNSPQNLVPACASDPFVVASCAPGPKSKRPSREKVLGGYYADEEKGRKENRKEESKEVGCFLSGSIRLESPHSAETFLFAARACVKFGNRSPGVVEST